MILAAEEAILVSKMPLQAQTTTITVRGNMDPSQENPPISPGTGASGYTECTFDVSLNTGTCMFTVYNFPSGATVAHIHAGAPRANGPTIVTIPLPVNFSNDLSVTWTVNAGNMTARPDAGIRSIEDLIQACVAGACYVNVHSVVNPGGEIRGQLCPESRTNNFRTGVAVCTTPVN
jgi:hypothetical protein